MTKLLLHLILSITVNPAQAGRKRDPQSQHLLSKSVSLKMLLYFTGLAECWKLLGMIAGRCVQEKLRCGHG